MDVDEQRAACESVTQMVGDRDPILNLGQMWLDKIVSGEKTTMEINGCRFDTHIGKHIWPCESKSFQVSGRAVRARSATRSHSQ